MDDELEAIAASDASVPLLLGLDERDVLEVDWDELDHVGLMAEFSPVQKIKRPQRSSWGLIGSPLVIAGSFAKKTWT